MGDIRFMSKKDIMLYDFKIGSWDDDFNPEEAILCFESLVGRPCKDLVDKYNKTHSQSRT